MIQHHSILAGWFLLAAVCPAATPPPPNDRFVDRIVLSGSSIDFTGTLAGATSDSFDEVFGYPYAYSCGAVRSVWWSWTAAETKAVTIQAIDQWPVSFVAAHRSDLLVYSNSPASGFPTNDPWHTPPVTGMWMYSPLAPSCSFAAEAGREYFIQLHSGERGEGYYVTNDYAFNLTATNPPILLRPPKSVTAAADASTLFTVVALGVRPLSYQWRFNGADLPGRTFPMLPLDGLSASNAGDYTVVVSNLTGMSTSAVATLAVSSALASPLLTARGDGRRAV